MKKLTKRFVFGAVVGSLLFTASTAFAWTAYNKNIPVRFAQIKLIINGKTIQTKAEPFIYNGNVYAPVATVANMLGIKQEWDNATPAVRFSDENKGSGFKAKEIAKTLSEITPETWLSDQVYIGKRQTPAYVPIDQPKGGPMPGQSYRALVDLSNPSDIKIHHLDVRSEWVGVERYYSLTDSFLNVTGKSNHEFIIFEQTGTSLRGKPENMGYVHLYRYEKGKLTSASANLFDMTSHEADIRYVPASKEFIVNFLDTNGKTVKTFTRKADPKTYGDGTEYSSFSFFVTPIHSDEIK